MQVTGTKAAFEKMLEVPAINKVLGVDSSTVANWKRYVREGRHISTDKMEEMLLKFGAKVKSDKIWDMNKFEDSDKWVSVDHRLPEIDPETGSSRNLTVKVNGVLCISSAVYRGNEWYEAHSPHLLPVTEWLDDPIEKR